MHPVMTTEMLVPAAEATFTTRPPFPPLSFLICSTASNVPLITAVWNEKPLHFSPLLTHCRLNELIHTIYWESPILSLGSSGYEI